MFGLLPRDHREHNFKDFASSTAEPFKHKRRSNSIDIPAERVLGKR